MTHDDEPRLPSAWFWAIFAAGAIVSAVLIGWLIAVLP
jgi:fumarate reductase subunit D